MSSRSSHYYANQLHLFVEQNYGAVCLDFPSEINEAHADKKDGSFTMSDEAWIEFANSILKAVNEARNFK